jgi:hypothetical protein
MNDNFAKVKVFVPKGATPASKPTTKAMASFEKRNNLVLPPSYKEFIKQFGPGEIGSILRIAAPGYPSLTEWDLELLNQGMNIGSFRNEFPPNLSKTSNYYFFGDTFGGDMIAWQTSTNREGEYPIVAFPRDDSAVLVLASTFGKLIDAVLRGKLKDPIGKLHPESQPERHQFRPATISE